MTNVLGAIRTGSVTFNQALANALDTAIKSSWSANLAPRCATSFSLTSVGVRDINTPSNPEFIGSGAAVVGTGTGDILPRQIALCVTLRTALTGPSHRGRVYINGFVEAENDVNQLASSAAQTGAVAFVNGIMTALGNNGLQLAVLSRPVEARVIPAVPEITIPGRPGQGLAVTVPVMRNGTWDTQRRRRGGTP
jgi:hypothetical protein